MQIIMSPAKLMNFNGQDKNIETTTPLFAQQTEEILQVCQKLSASEIAGQMKVNAGIAKNVFEYFQTYNAGSTPSKAAALAYNGIAYQGLAAGDFGADEVKFAQRHLNLISGFYGVLRPFDKIKPYRLEFSRKIQPQGYKNLYDFWQKHINQYMSEKLKDDEPVIINVASKEYAKTIVKKMLPANTRIIDIEFLQQKGEHLKQIVVHSKKARGLMARFIIKNQLKHSEEVKLFDYENYFFYPQLSSNDKWVFIR